ncbi:hypothetical protein QBC34DRAFT_442167 [Podospora aff. communis PSN243]|uniref:SnoaL-like domain-containing protein n=1 Tax=Podospora aff. communis PSN243 TaxID=3040156 RepID=A0AAV9G8V3_9PEZI|nr:hypothetical protein QBC34DRAFT_442167 [Podospora aff. communis PSN243]
MTSHPDTKQLALATLTGYAHALTSGAAASLSIPDISSQMARYYLPGCTAFTLGTINAFPDEAFTRSMIQNQLERFTSLGVGINMRLEKARIEVISETSAACWATFAITPKNGEGWSWTNVYGFRAIEGRENGLKGGWEWVVGDGEMTELLARYPDAMEH